jgi:hypothetical protein
MRRDRKTNPELCNSKYLGEQTLKWESTGYVDGNIQQELL